MTAAVNKEPVALRNLPAVFVRKLRTAQTNPRLALRRLLSSILVGLIGFPAAVLMRITWPWISIRICRIDTGRIGHFAGACHTYLCERASGKHAGYIDVFFRTTQPVNNCLYHLVRKKMRFFQLSEYVDAASRQLPNWERHSLAVSSLDREGVTLEAPPPIVLDKETIERGDKWLTSLGIEPEKQVILFANRDAAHLDHISPSKDWSYHDYRDSSIQNMLPMAQRFASKGMGVVRAGAHVSESLETADPAIVDYPSRHRTEERDIYLAFRSKFCVATASGVLDLPRLFHTPVANCNVAPLQALNVFKARATDLWIPKRYWSKEQKRFMTFSEIVGSGAGQFVFTKQFSDAGIELIENTPEEILDLAVEMEEILEDRRVLDGEERKMIDTFWNIALEGRAWNGETQIALSFLKRHPDLVR